MFVHRTIKFNKLRQYSRSTTSMYENGFILPIKRVVHTADTALPRKRPIVDSSVLRPNTKGFRPLDHPTDNHSTWWGTSKTWVRVHHRRTSLTCSRRLRRVRRFVYKRPRSRIEWQNHFERRKKPLQRSGRRIRK